MLPAGWLAGWQGGSESHAGLKQGLSLVCMTARCRQTDRQAGVALSDAHNAVRRTEYRQAHYNIYGITPGRAHTAPCGGTPSFGYISVSPRISGVRACVPTRRYGRQTATLQVAPERM